MSSDNLVIQIQALAIQGLSEKGICKKMEMEVPP